MIEGSTPMGRPLRGRAHRRALVLVVVGLLLGTPASLSAAEEQPDYGARPALVGETVRQEGSFVHALEPGGSFTDAVEIFNFTSEPARFDVYATDLVVSADSNTAPASPSGGGPASWISFAEPSVEVPAHSSILVDFTLEAPLGTVPDEYLAAVMVEAPAAEGTGNIVTNTRVGLRVKIEVLGEINIGIGLGDLDYVGEGGGYRFIVAVENTGDVTYEVAGEIQVNNRIGEPYADVPVEPGDLSLAPGEEMTVEAVWEDPPLLGVVEASARVEAFVTNRVPREAQSEIVEIWIIPWALILGTIGAMALMVWAFSSTKRRRTEWVRQRRQEREIIRELRAHRSVHETDTTKQRQKAVGRHRR